MSIYEGGRESPLCSSDGNAFLPRWNVQPPRFWLIGVAHSCSRKDNGLVPSFISDLETKVLQFHAVQTAVLKTVEKPLWPLHQLTVSTVMIYYEPLNNLMDQNNNHLFISQFCGSQVLAGIKGALSGLSSPLCVR